MTSQETQLRAFLTNLMVVRLCSIVLNTNTSDAVTREAQRCIRITKSSKNRGVLKSIIKSKDPGRVVELLELREDV